MASHVGRIDLRVAPVVRHLGRPYEMTDALQSLIAGLVGLVLILFAFVALALRSGRKAISWRGFGVTFEIRSCAECPVIHQHRSSNEKHSG